MIDVLKRHERVALSFSGGKDSLACVYLLRGNLDRVTVYHLDTGDLLPEIAEVVEHVKGLAPRFVRIRQDTAGWIDRHGLPSDLIPWTGHVVAGAIGHRPRLVPRFECCLANLMLPLWERIRDDGNTLVIRGTRADDMPRLPAASGAVLEGVEICNPLQDWSAERVFAYLKEQGAPIARVYSDGRTQAPECATCPAWWSEGRAAYLKRYHPDLLRKYRARMAVVMAELDAPLMALNSELKELSA